MIAVIYRFCVRPTQFDRYQRYWVSMVDFLRNERGAVGSVLHRVGNEQLVIYSNWPDRATYERAWPDEDKIEDELPKEIAAIALNMRDCIVGEVDVQVLDVVSRKL